jgi:exonuclease III
MPFYSSIRRFDEADRIRTIDNLLQVREQLAKDVPARTARDTMLLATWNLRDFDSNKFKHGPRLPESFYYIAEVISAFDLVAVQEVNRDLSAWNKIMRILGSNWDFIATDTTEGRSGNNERMTFVFDKRKVSFQNIAGEIVLPAGTRIEEDRQFARTPFSCDFQCGWLKFTICSVHIYFGDDRGEKFERRVEEIGRIAKFLADRAKRYDNNIILLGDMNIVEPGDPTMKALEKSGFVVPEGLAMPTNMLQNKFYDQIAFYYRRDQLELGESERNAGVFDLYKRLFTTREAAKYFKIAKPKGIGQWPASTEARKKYFKNWRTFQLSDHMPLWVELKIDFTEKYLKRLRRGG